MQHSDPQEPSPRDSGGANGAEYDALRRLEERLDRASSAAERLIAEAAWRSSAPAGERREPPEPPPAGWQVPEPDPPPRGHGAELELLTALVQSLRDLIPPELQQRLAEALRELLLAIRALIDWYLDRLDRRAKPVEVQDIPIT